MMSEGLTDTELRRFREIQQERSARQSSTATQALSGRDLETFQRIQAERAQDIRALNAPPWDSTRIRVNSSELGDPGLPDLDVRASLSTRETVQERAEAFRRAFPMGELQDAIDEQGNTFRVFRRDTAEPWRKLDPGPTEKTEILPDLADFAGDIPEIVGEALTTRGTGGVIRTGFRAGIGAAGGTLAEETGESALGQQRQDLGQVLQTAGAESLAAGLGTVATAPLSMTTNAIIGARNIGLLPGAHAAIEAEGRQGLPLLTPGQIAASPMVRRTATYGETFSSAMQMHVLNQQGAAARRLQELDVSGAADIPLYTRAGVAAREAELLESMQRPGTNLSRDWAQAGTELMEGFKEYDTIARLEVDDLFLAGRRIEEPTFDLDRLNAVVELGRKQGVVETGRPDAPVRPLDPHNAALQGVLNDISNFNGQPKEVTLPDGTVATLSVTDQLRAFRESLWDLKTVAPGERAGRPEADASYFYNEITSILKNPTNSSAEFLEAWSNANEAASRRFQVWDELTIRTIKRAQDPDSLAREFVAPGNRYQLQTIKETIPAENWERFRQSAMQEVFFNNPRDITNQFNRYDIPTLITFMKPTEIASVREIGKNLDKLTPLYNLADLPRWQDMGRAMMNAPDARYVVAGEEIGGRFSPSGMRLRAGILQSVINDVVQQTKSGTIVDRVKLSNILQKIRTNGAEEYLTASDLEVLTDIHRYLDFAQKDTADMGASLMGSQQQLGMIREFSTEALVNILQTIYVGEFLISPAGRRLLIGRDAQRPTYETLRLIGAATGTLVSSFEQDPEELTNDD